MYEWLSYGNLPTRKVDDNYWGRREWSFELDGDIVVRHLSFQDFDSFRREIIKRCPQKIDIGAIHTREPANKAAYAGDAYVALEKELVFDIDMDDYNDIRSCCASEKGKVCHKCWVFMTIAIKVLHHALTEDFGFEHILFVYSGRRGVHCWVADERARALNEEQRVKLCNSLHLVGNIDGKGRVGNLQKQLYPRLEEEKRLILEPLFREVVLKEQGILDDPESWKGVLDMIPMPELRVRLDEKWREQLTKKSGADRWEILKVSVEKAEATLATKRDPLSYKLAACVNEILFAYTYPRLDINVSKGLNHLLKSPWCIHPKTGRVCVPIDPLHAESFDFAAVPTVAQLLDEVNKYDSANGGAGAGGGDVENWAKTSLKPYMKIFRTFLDGVKHMTLAKKRLIAGQNIDNW